MKTILLHVLLLAVLLPSFSAWGIIAHYQLNKDYIARVFCENRDRPELHCDGKCYLAKRLKAQQDKQDKETTERVSRTNHIQLFCEPSLAFQFADSSTPIIRRNVFSYTAAAYLAPLGGLFRPPTA